MAQEKTWALEKFKSAEQESQLDFSIALTTISVISQIVENR